jgi:hypothetical protein
VGRGEAGRSIPPKADKSARLHSRIMNVAGVGDQRPEIGLLTSEFWLLTPFASLLTPCALRLAPLLELWWSRRSIGRTE